MREEKIKIYKFEELPKEVQQKVIEEERKWGYEYLSDNWDWMEENYKEDLLEEYGITTEKFIWDENNSFNCGFEGYVTDYVKFFNKIGYDNMAKLIEEDEKSNRMVIGDDLSISWKIRDRVGMELYECLNPIDEDYTQELIEENIIENLPALKRIEDIESIWGDIIEYVERDFVREMQNYIYDRVNDDYESGTSDDTIIENIKYNELEYTIEGEQWN